MKRIVPATLLTIVTLVGLNCVSLNALAQYEGEFQNPAARQKYADFEQFLAAHPWIAEKLKKDPSLANKGDFLDDNKEFRQFLNAHPFVQSDLKADPQGFIQREQTFERWEKDLAMSSGDPNIRARAEFSQFLDNHSWITKQLQEKPARANDKDFLNDNPELRQFLNAHGGVQARLREDPVGFMAHLHDINFSPGGGPGDDDEAMRQQLADFRRFLDDHSQVAGTLRSEPGLATDSGYLDRHPELRDFLSSHSRLQRRLSADPQGVMNRVYPQPLTK